MLILLQKKLFYSNLVHILFIMIIIIIGLYWISAKISSPIINLCNTVEKFSKGDFNAKTNVQSKDEIGYLASLFDKMGYELTIQQELTQGVIDTAQVIILVLDIEGKIVQFNPFMEKLTGYFLEEVKGKDWFSTFLPDENHDEIRSVFKKAIANIQTSGNQNPIVCKDGRLVDTLWYDKTFKDINGNIKGLISIGVDITKYKKQEELLRKSEGHLVALIKTIPDLVWLKNSDGVYLSCNAKFERFFGTEKANIIGKTDYDFLDKEQADFFRQKDKDAMIAGKPTVNEEEVVYADDNHHEQLETIKTPMYDSKNRLLGVLGIARDITKHKKMESLLKKTNVELENAHKHAMYMLALASEYKDPETGGHIKRIVRMTTKLALELGIESELAEQMGDNSLLHDLGKLGISDYILLKPGKLTDNEFETMKQHTLIGANIIGDDEWFYMARQIALLHHERWDGTGYPEGLKGDAIPLAARIVAVADEFDALISKRPYKEPWSLERSIEEIKLEAGKHFDPKVVEAFLSLCRKGFKKL